MSRSTRPRRQLSKAELKAYQARRAEEIQRIGVAPSDDADGDGRAPTPTRRSYMLSRAEEFAIIRSDLRRLLMIIAVLTLALIAATFVLR